MTDHNLKSSDHPPHFLQMVALIIRKLLQTLCNVPVEDRSLHPQCLHQWKGVRVCSLTWDIGYLTGGEGWKML